MSDEPKPAPAPEAAAAPTPAPPQPAAPTPAPPAPPPAASDHEAIDWVSLLPSTLGEVLSDVVKLTLGAFIIMNVWAVWHAVAVTRNMAIAGSAAALGFVVAWKAYGAIASAKGKRVVGIGYAVVGAAIGITIISFGQSAGSIHESHQLRSVVSLIGAIFLYPAALGLMTAITGKEPRELNPLGFPLSPSWFGTIWTLYAKEVRTFFTTAIPYLVLFCFLMLNGYLFWLLLAYYSQPGAPGGAPSPQVLFHNGITMISLIMICPAITMRLISEEKRMGTVESLLTAPVTDIQVILSKYAAAMTFFAVLVSTMLVFLAILSGHAKEWDWGPVYSGLIGMFLWGGVSIAIGLFWSTLTEDQVVAFILAAMTNLFLYFASAMESFVPEDTTWKILPWDWWPKALSLDIHVKEVVRFLSLGTHYDELLRGIVSTKSLVFFGVTIGLALFASVRGLESQRWK